MKHESDMIPSEPRLTLRGAVALITFVLLAVGFIALMGPVHNISVTKQFTERPGE